MLCFLLFWRKRKQSTLLKATEFIHRDIFFFIANNIYFGLLISFVFFQIIEFKWWIVLFYLRQRCILVLFVCLEHKHAVELCMAYSFRYSLRIWKIESIKFTEMHTVAEHRGRHKIVFYLRFVILNKEMAIISNNSDCRLLFVHSFN